MFNIENLLNKFRNITPPDDLVKTEISRIFSEKIKLEIDKKKIKVINGIAYIDASPAVKSAIFTGKSNILKEINSQLNKKEIIKDIR